MYFGKPMGSGKPVISSKSPSHARSRCDQSDRCKEDQRQDDTDHGCGSSSGICCLVEYFDEWVPSRALLGVLDVPRAEQDCHKSREAQDTIKSRGSHHYPWNHSRSIGDLLGCLSTVSAHPSAANSHHRN